MMDNFISLEKKRQKLQVKLDNLKTQKERNILGQFSTPIDLANDILLHTSSFMPKNEKIRFLDPAFGTGVFFSALNNIFQTDRISAASGFEIDEHYGVPSKELWKNTLLEYKIDDFTSQDAPINEDDKFNLIICNPPYVRHHHIKENKDRLSKKVETITNIRLSGLSGLYCYFIALTHSWLKKGGVAGWLIPSEFMDVNYGLSVKAYLLNEVELLQIHRFNPNEVQFNDALVSSAVVWFKKEKPTSNHKVIFTYGGTIDKPKIKKEISSSTLENETKWTRFPILQERKKSSLPKLKDFFTIKRGIATGDNNFFILSLDQINSMELPLDQFRPILPSPRFLNVEEIGADENGFPDIDKKLFVLDCKLHIDNIKQNYPKLYSYLLEGIDSGVTNRYICKNRKIWYLQENRQESQFYFTYIGRSDNGKKPFRFILNQTKAIVTNSYLILYPKPFLANIIKKNPDLNKSMIKALNTITGRKMLEEGRVYGGGMHKLEPKELANVPAIELELLLKKQDKVMQENDILAIQSV